MKKIIEKQKKNLLFLMSSKGEIGGIETVTNNIIETLKIKYNIKVVYIDGKTSLLKENEYILKPSLRYNNFILRKFSLIFKTISLFFYKRKNKIEIVFSGGSFCNTFEGISRIFSKNISIASIHSIQSKEALGRKGFYPKLCHFSNKYLLNKFDEVISISKGVKEDLLLTYPNLLSIKNKVIYNGFNFEKIITLSKEINKYEKDSYFIFVGRIVEEKQIETIIKTFYFFKKKNKNYKLLIIGSGNSEYESKLKNFIKILEIESSVIFLGKQENPYKYIKNAKALLLSSKYEGLPSVIIEALILNVLVVSTNSSSGIHEILDKNYKLGEDNNLRENKILKNGIITPFILGNMEINLTKEEEYFLNALNIVIRKSNNVDLEKDLESFNIKETILQYERIINRYE